MRRSTLTLSPSVLSVNPVENCTLGGQWQIIALLLGNRLQHVHRIDIDDELDVFFGGWVQLCGGQADRLPEQAVVG